MLCALSEKLDILCVNNKPKYISRKARKGIKYKVHKEFLLDVNLNVVFDNHSGLNKAQTAPAGS